MLLNSDLSGPAGGLVGTGLLQKHPAWGRPWLPMLGTAHPGCSPQTTSGILCLPKSLLDGASQSLS